jgi:polar amino acid transport system substrate-binding protein
MRFAKLNILVLILCLMLPSLPVRAGTTLDNLRQNKVLRVGIREDAVPFGYRSNQGHLSGLCIDFIALLKQKILTDFDQDILSIRLVESNLVNRFRLVEDNVVDIECGPNTITKNPRYKISFSQPFFVTGTQFLIKKDQKDKINLSSDLANISLGVLQNTGNEVYLKKTYPEANIVLFQGVMGRTRGVQAVSRGNIDAMVSDGILLLGEAIVLGLAIDKDYTLLPDKPITCDYYGMILPRDDPEWRALVNTVIEEFSATEENWLKEIRVYLNQARNNCQNQ